MMECFVLMPASLDEMSNLMSSQNFRGENVAVFKWEVHFIADFVAVYHFFFVQPTSFSVHHITCFDPCYLVNLFLL